MATNAAASQGLSLGGKFFFGGLTAGTFGLGCWQVQRYYEKADLMTERTAELAMAPSTDWRSKEHPYQPKLLEGKLLHSKEVLIGPRGAPMCPRQQQQTGGGGMAPGAQGYMVLTPLQMIDGNLVWVNRGWVPRALVPGTDPRGKQPIKETPYPAWDRPSGTVQITAIQTPPEKPKMIAIEHDYSKRPLQLFWMDGIALQAIAESQQETTLMTQVTTTPTETASTAQEQLPRAPSLDSMAEFKTTPLIHAGYAATWYGLSVAGMFMTRKLITRGRG